MKRAIVTGAGGFIGHHLVRYLQRKGYLVRGVDKKYSEFGAATADEFIICDLRNPDEARRALLGCENAEIYHLAADMGGIGYITYHLVDCAVNNAKIDLNVLSVVAEYGCRVFVGASSACVYPQRLQDDASEAPRLKESDAWPADPERGYGLQKLYTEELLRYYHQERGIETRIVRPHNVYGPRGEWRGGREKAPAAICRKVAMANESDKIIDVWGDGLARRSFLYVDDFCRGIHLLAQHKGFACINLGHEQDVSVKELVEMVISISGKSYLIPEYQRHGGPQGVRSRSCDGTLAKNLLGWEPQVDLRSGLEKTYEWIRSEVNQ